MEEELKAKTIEDEINQKAETINEELNGRYNLDTYFAVQQIQEYYENEKNKYTNKEIDLEEYVTRLNEISFKQSKLIYSLNNKKRKGIEYLQSLEAIEVQYEEEHKKNIALIKQVNDIKSFFYDELGVQTKNKDRKKTSFGKKVIKEIRKLQKDDLLNNVNLQERDFNRGIIGDINEETKRLRENNNRLEDIKTNLLNLIDELCEKNKIGKTVKTKFQQWQENQKNENEPDKMTRKQRVIAEGESEITQFLESMKEEFEKEKDLEYLYYYDQINRYYINYSKMHKENKISDLQYIEILGQTNREALNIKYRILQVQIMKKSGKNVINTNKEKFQQHYKLEKSINQKKKNINEIKAFIIDNLGRKHFIGKHILKLMDKTKITEESFNEKLENRDYTKVIENVDIVNERLKRNNYILSKRQGKMKELILKLSKQIIIGPIVRNSFNNWYNSRNTKEVEER